MAELSPTHGEKARKAASTVLRAMETYGKQGVLASAMKTSDATVSRLRNEQLDMFCLLLAHLDLKVVPAGMQCFPPEKIQALLTLAKDHLAAIEHPHQLTWD